MNVYLIDVNGDRQCWKAETPQEAMNQSMESYCREAAEANMVDSDDPPQAQWGRTFRSCQRVGTLANP